jgi:hypothetical protein
VKLWMKKFSTFWSFLVHLTYVRLRQTLVMSTYIYIYVYMFHILPYMLETLLLFLDNFYGHVAKYYWRMEIIKWSEKRVAQNICLHKPFIFSILFLQLPFILLSQHHKNICLNKLVLTLSHVDDNKYLWHLGIIEPN